MIATGTAVATWLDQFKTPKDKALAEQLISHFRLVTNVDLSTGILDKLKLLSSSEPIAVFLERSLPKHLRTSSGTYKLPLHFRSANAGKTLSFQRKEKLPQSMYKHSKIKVPGRRKYWQRAYGAAMQAVKSDRNDKQDIGSEGTMATTVSSLARAYPNQVAMNPSADSIRTMRIRHIVIVTDFIGSGDRAKSMMDSLWSVRSIRSWRSSRLIKISVLAYSSTITGSSEIRNHRCKPNVDVVVDCPTIDDLGTDADDARELCYRLAPQQNLYLGYGQSGALIAFEHSCPNNAPSIFLHQKAAPASRKWIPLFKSRVTRDVFGQSRKASKLDQDRLALETLRFQSIANSARFLRSKEVQRNLILLLASLSRGRSRAHDVSIATGLSLFELERARDKAIADGLSDTNDRLTRQGHRLLIDLVRLARARIEEKRADMSYHPTQLRSPMPRT